jgi:hypothetical protein
VLSASDAVPNEVWSALAAALLPLPDVDVPGLAPFVPPRQGPYVTIVARSMRTGPEPRASASLVAQMSPGTPDLVLDLVRSLSLRTKARTGIRETPSAPDTVARMFSLGVLCGVAALKYATVPEADRSLAAMALGISAALIVLLDAQPPEPPRPVVPAPPAVTTIVEEPRPEDPYRVVEEMCDEFGSVTVVVGMGLEEVLTVLGANPELKPTVPKFELLRPFVILSDPAAVALYEPVGMLGYDPGDVARLSARGMAASVRWDIHGAYVLTFAEAGELLDSFEDWEDAKHPRVTSLMADIDAKDYRQWTAKCVLVVQRFTGDLLTPEIVVTMMRAEEGYDCGW